MIYYFSNNIEKIRLRVFENLGYLVDKLSRIEYAFLSIDNLRSGEYRELTKKEIKKLYEY